MSENFTSGQLPVNAIENNTTGDLNNFTLYELCEQSYFRIPANWIVTLQFILTTGILVVNTFISTVFLQSQNRTPTTILLSALAITDCLTALMVTIRYSFACIFYFNEVFGKPVISDGFPWPEMYTECIYLAPVDELVAYFHLMSVQITVGLSIQKCIVLKFPIWSKSNIDNKSSSAFITFVFIATLAFYIYITILNHSMFSEGSKGECCFNDVLGEADVDWIETTINIFMCSSVLIIIICNIYICWKLIHVGRSDFCHQYKKARRQRTQSAVIVVVISTVFIISEILNILQTLNSTRLIQAFDRQIRSAFDSYYCLSWSLGFSLNFIVYIAMSQHLRQTIVNSVCFRCRQSKPGHHMASRRTPITSVSSSITT